MILAGYFACFHCRPHDIAESLEGVLCILVVVICYVVGWILLLCLVDLCYELMYRWPIVGLAPQVG